MKSTLSLRIGCGQTLVEVLVTLLFISVGVVAIVKFQNYLAYDSALSQQRGEATILAVRQVETLRNFQVINNTTGYASYQNIASGSSSSTVGNTAYSLTWVVTTYTNPDYKRLDVVVSWTDRHGGAQSVQMVTNVGSISPANSAAIM